MVIKLFFFFSLLELLCLAINIQFLQVLEEIKLAKEMDRDTLINVARTSLRTKVDAEVADLLTEVCLHFS